MKYQSTTLSPQNKARNVPVIKKGPKGTSDFKVFLPKVINPNPIIAPIKKAENKATKIFGKLKKSPIKKANLMSPIPIHFPRETRKIIKNKLRTNLSETKTGVKFLI